MELSRCYIKNNVDAESRLATRRLRAFARAAAVIAFLAASPRSVAQSPSLAEPQLAARLRQRVTLAWSGQEFAAALAGLAQVHGIPLWIDRRIDPHAAIDLAVNDVAVAAAFNALATDEHHDRGWTALRTVVYVGPRESARELATLSELARQAIAKAPADVRRKWLTAAPWDIPRLSEPRALLDETVAKVGGKVLGSAAIPHDLWAARAVPTIAPIDRVVLLLAGFDLAAEPSPDGRQLRVAPIKRPVQLTREYPVNERTEAAAAALTSADDAVRVRRQGRRLVLAGRWEDHERLRAAMRGTTPQSPPEHGPPRPRGDQRFTLRIASKPVGPVLAQLAAQLQLTIAWDPALTAATPTIAETLVSCEVREADLDGLFAAILEPAGLAFVREGQTVTISAAK